MFLRLQKLFSSPVVLFVYYCLTFGVLIQFLASERPFSWTFAAVTGVPFALIMTWLTLRRAKAANRLTGLADLTQIQQLHTALRTGKLPDDPKVRKALPAHLHHSLVMFSKAWRISGLVFLAVIWCALLLMLNDNRDLFHVLIAASFPFIFLMGYASMRKMRANIDSLYKQLDLQPQSIQKSRPWPRKAWVAVAILAIVMFIVMPLGFNAVQKPASNMTGEPSVPDECVPMNGSCLPAAEIQIQRSNGANDIQIPIEESQLNSMELAPSPYVVDDGWSN